MPGAPLSQLVRSGRGEADPVATGRPLPSRARAWVIEVVNAGPDAVLARPLALASYPVATGRADHGLAVSALARAYG